MATSDNVVRAGLTPKFKDVDTLVGMLDYTPRTKAENIMSYVTRDNDSDRHIFMPPVPDFGVHSATCSPCGAESADDEAAQE